MTFLFTACAAPPIDPEVGVAIAAATGVEGVELRQQGAPIDEPGAGDRLRLADAVQRGVARSPEVHAALARVRAAMVDAGQARLLANPVLSLLVRFGSGRPEVEAGLAATLAQWLERPRRATAADHRLRQAAAAAVVVALDAVQAAQEAYLSVQASEARLPLLAERQRLVARLVEVAESRLAAGFGTRGDVATLLAQRVDLEVEQAAATQQAKQDRLHLGRLLGEPSGAVAWELDQWSAPAAPAAGEPQWIEAALARRPEVSAIDWRLAALRDEAALAGLQVWEDAELGAAAERTDHWRVGPALTMPVPLFATGSTQRERVAAELLAAGHERTAIARGVVEDVRRAHAELAAALANLARVQKELLPLQQQRRQQAEDAYRAGETDVTELFLAEQDLRAAQARAIDIERQAGLALVRLQRAVGGPGAAAALEGGS